MFVVVFCSVMDNCVGFKIIYYNNFIKIIKDYFSVFYYIVSSENI